jgi:uncharacterized membrane protein (UPF0127 family)
MKTPAARALCLVLIALAGCDSKPNAGLPVAQIQIGPQKFNIEIATSFHDQEVGLMHRDHLDPDHGMIFIFDTPTVQHFWNHDVHFALDNLFLAADGTIVSIKHMDAYSEKDTSSDLPAQYVIELLGGTAGKLNIKPGDHISLPPGVVHPPATGPTTATQPTTSPAQP